MSRKTRAAQQELRKFEQASRKLNPGMQSYIQYDRLCIDGTVYMWCAERGEVVRGGSPGLSHASSRLSLTDREDRSRQTADQE